MSVFIKRISYQNSCSHNAILLDGLNWIEEVLLMILPVKGKTFQHKVTNNCEVFLSIRFLSVDSGSELSE